MDSEIIDCGLKFVDHEFWIMDTDLHKSLCTSVWIVYCVIVKSPKLLSLY